MSRSTSLLLALATAVAAAVAPGGALAQATPPGLSPTGSSDDDACATVLGEYDLDLHVVAIFVLLVASAFGVFFPVVLGQKKRASKAVEMTFFVLRHFGSGIIISTAFCHLMLEAFLYYHNECMGALAYPATAPAIMMAATFLVFLVDFFAARYMYNERIRQHEEARAARVEAGRSSSSSTTGEIAPVAVGLSSAEQEKHESAFAGHSHDFAELDVMTSDQFDRRARWDVELLEAGICFHSVFIGITLGAQGGNQFVPTFVALVFHQLFEGLGLGARIGRLQYPNGTSWQKWLMCILYTLITPLGIAIGIAVRTTINFSGRSTLLVVGTFDSISAGILLYGGIAQILVGDWLAGDIRRSPLSKIGLGLGSLVAGLMAMSIIAQWT